jgi:hypothetical protein
MLTSVLEIFPTLADREGKKQAIRGNLSIELPGHLYHVALEKMRGHVTKQKYLAEVVKECIARMPEEFENPKAMFAAHTLSMPESMIPAFYKDYKGLLEKYMATSPESDEHLEILQVCLQALPFTLPPNPQE